jgi:hypothetical protein
VYDLESVSLAGDIRLNFFSKTARRGDLVDNFGIDNNLPSNPFVFTLEAGSHPKYLGTLLVYSSDSNPIPGNRQLIHNEKGVFHEVKVLTTGSLRLGEGTSVGRVNTAGAGTGSHKGTFHGRGIAAARRQDTEQRGKGKRERKG